MTKAYSLLALPLLSTSAFCGIRGGSGSHYHLDPRPTETRRLSAQQENVGAILTLGARNDVASRPLFERLALNPVPSEEEISSKCRGARNTFDACVATVKDRRLDASRAAKLALARMGDKEYLKEFIVGLSSASVEWRRDCIFAIGYIGNKKAAKHIGPLLYSDQIPPQPERDRDIGNPPDSDLAVMAFLDLFRDEEKNYIEKMKDAKDQHLTKQQWRQWWEENKDKFK